MKYDWQWTYAGSPATARIPRGPMWLRNLLGDDYFDDVVDAAIAGRQATDELAEKLSWFPRLRSASFTRGPLTDAGLEHFGRLRQIQVLRLDDTGVTDVGLRRLVGLTQLKDLSLENTQLTDAVLAELEGLAHLEKLNVNGTKVTPDGVARFRRAAPKCDVFLLNPFPATEPQRPSHE